MAQVARLCNALAVRCVISRECYGLRRSYKTTTVVHRERYDRKSILSRTVPKDEGVDGERSFEIEQSTTTTSTLFPDENTPSLLFDGVPYNEVPICHINISKNNTKYTVTDYKGKTIKLWTAGTEGFHKCKKGTNIAAQAAAITLCSKVADHGITNVRVKIGGLGPGRAASIKGLVMGGMKIVSISDTTPAPPMGHPRPKKQRRL